MARINLLPWRAERRKQREREFYMMLAASAAAAVFIFFCASYWMGQRIENQGARNAYLVKQIKLLDEEIETIKDLERVRSDLLARKEIIEDLQSNRSQMVHLFDQLAKTIPEGMRLTSLKQNGDTLTLEGVAESSTRVATYMKAVENSPQMGRADLAKIESKEGAAGADSKMPYVFSLSAKTKKSDDQTAEAPPAQGAATDNAGKKAGETEAKPADLGAQLDDAASKLISKTKPEPAAAEEKKP